MMNQETEKPKESIFLRATNNLSNKLLWGVYISLLAVLFPHTAWAFALFEPDTFTGKATSYAAAFAFEAAIAVLVHKLADHIERVPKYKDKWKRFYNRYFNAYSGGLVLALFVSTAANMAHAVEYGMDGNIRIVEEWNLPFGVLVFAFGAFLPLCSILFARVLSDVQDDYDVDSDANIAKKLADEIERLKKANRSMTDKLKEAADKIEQLKQKMSASSVQLRTELETANYNYEQLRAQYEHLERTSGQLSGLVSDDKKARIQAAYTLWPELSVRSIATITESSPSYTSTVINDLKGGGVNA